MLQIFHIYSIINVLKWLVCVLLLDLSDCGSAAVCVGCVRVARNAIGLAVEP